MQSCIKLNRHRLMKLLLNCENDITINTKCQRSASFDWHLALVRYLPVTGTSEHVFLLLFHCYRNAGIKKLLLAAVAEKFQRAFLDVLLCRCWSRPHNSTLPGVQPARGADTRYMATYCGRRTQSPYAV